MNWQLWRHRYFYTSIVIGAAAWAAASFFVPRLQLPIAADAFFGSYVLLIFILAANSSPKDLRELAACDDEGAWIITLVTLSAITFSLYLIFALLKDYANDTPRLVLSVLSAPLGWAMLHTMEAFHYAHKYYTDIDDDPDRRVDAGGLKFPACDDPGGWDFLYFSFVVGMTTQVSDVQVTSTPVRKLTIIHGIASFFINTGLLAVAVNIVVAIASK